MTTGITNRPATLSRDLEREWDRSVLIETGRPVRLAPEEEVRGNLQALVDGGLSAGDLTSKPLSLAAWSPIELQHKAHGGGLFRSLRFLAADVVNQLKQVALIMLAPQFAGFMAVVQAGDGGGPGQPGERSALSTEEERRITEEERRIFDQNRYLVPFIARKYFWAGSLLGIPSADILAVGEAALIKAIRRYDKKRGALSTYATICIKGQILDLFRSKTDQAKRGGILRNFEDIIPKDIAEGLGANDPGALGAEDTDIDEVIYLKEMGERLLKILEGLDVSARDDKIFRRYLEGINNNLIGREFNLSRERVRQIIGRILDMLNRQITRGDGKKKRPQPAVENKGPQMVYVSTPRPESSGRPPQVKPRSAQGVSSTGRREVVESSGGQKERALAECYLARLKGVAERFLPVLISGSAPEIIAFFRNNVSADITTSQIALALRIEANKFELVMEKGELVWKWNYSPGKRKLTVGLNSMVDVHKLISEKLEIIGGLR